MDLAKLHPLLIHFPIALLIAALVFDLIGVLWKRASFHEAGLYVQVWGTLGAIAAVITGNQAEEAAEDIPGIEGVLELHESLGQAVMWVALASLALRAFLTYRGHLSAPFRSLLLVISLGLALLVSASAFYGGQLVYEFGAGVQQPGPRLPAEPQQNEEANGS